MKYEVKTQDFVLVFKSLPRALDVARASLEAGKTATISPVEQK